jgi:hypothetical protein
MFELIASRKFEHHVENNREEIVTAFGFIKQLTFYKRHGKLI